MTFPLLQLLADAIFLPPVLLHLIVTLKQDSADGYSHAGIVLTGQDTGVPQAVFWLVQVLIIQQEPVSVA